MLAPSIAIVQEVSPALLSQPASALAPRLDLGVGPGLLTQAATVLAPTVQSDQEVQPGLLSQPLGLLAPVISFGGGAGARYTRQLQPVVPLAQTVVAELIRRPLTVTAPLLLTAAPDEAEEDLLVLVGVL